MITKIKRTLKSVRIVSLIRLYKFGFLKSSGWNLSVKRSVPIDLEGKPIPWFTYSSIRFIENRLNKSFSVFEFGSGNSTIWFSNRVGNITSVEHDKKWFDFVFRTVRELSNVSYFNFSLNDGQYANSILQYQNQFDVVVIDGRDRVNCCYNAINALKKDGIIIWDNSDRDKYSIAYEFLHENGYKRIDFWGLGPININEWCTSIFYPENNCFNL